MSPAIPKHRSGKLTVNRRISLLTVDAGTLFALPEASDCVGYDVFTDFGKPKRNCGDPRPEF